jgi:hypothetical protein
MTHGVVPYPPDGQAREWWQRLKNAFGTTSSAFVDASLQQLIAAARLPNSGISETAVNASLAFIEGAKPQGEVECSLDRQLGRIRTRCRGVPDDPRLMTPRRPRRAAWATASVRPSPLHPPNAVLEATTSPILIRQRH